MQSYFQMILCSKHLNRNEEDVKYPEKNRISYMII